MSRARGSLGAALLTALVAAATTWVSMLSWRGFAVDSVGFLRPLLVGAAVLAVSGALARWYRLPGLAVVALQLLLGVAVLSWAVTGSPLPIGPSYAELVAGFGDAMDSANRYASPVPDRAPPIDPLLVAGGLGCLLLVDLLACTVRRVPLAGLPLLAVYSIPVSLLESDLAWWIFAASAAGFLTLLFLHENEQVARWGRPLGVDPTLSDPSAFTVRAGTARTSAGAIGGVATALAIVVPLAIPTLDVHVFDFGPGSGGDDEITLENPMTDLKRDLDRDEDRDLVRVTTDDPDPSYLRISVLNRFSDEEWTSGDRAIPTDQVPDGTMPPLEGVSGTVPRREHDYRVDVSSDFRSSWLPTQAPVSAIDADGDWRYDEATMDFIAANTGGDDLTTAGLSYSMTAVDLGLDPDDMADASSGAGLVDNEFIELPTDLPGRVRELATQVTATGTTPFEKAVALQQWFREDGGFEYSLEVDPGNGADALLDFLDNKVGYCEQFASAMAVMARALNIPARVAVGFLSPQQVGSTSTYIYSSHDLHAWPEIFVPGGPGGWPFEPTPAARANGVPSYTRIDLGRPDVPEPTAPTGVPSQEDQPSRGASASPTPTDTADPEAAAGGGGESGFPWLPVGGGLAGVLALAALLAVPRALRRARRERRLDGDSETVWAELRDSAVDLGVPWPAQRSPRETRDLLVTHFGTPSPGPAPERPAHGRLLAPGAARALDRIVVALEQARYAREAGEPVALREDAEACLAALRAGASPRVVRRAEWWPRTVFSRATPAVARPAGSRPTEAVHGGVVDHV